jgi:DNA-binding transcriptional ArsR family regulator
VIPGPNAAKSALTARLDHIITNSLYSRSVHNDMNTDHLSATFAALADPTRRAILARLAEGEATVMELGQPFAMSQPAISKHLKVLERAGLISRGREAQRRPCRLKATGLKVVAEWVGDYRRFWEESYERLDDLLETLKKKEKRHGRKKD